MWGKKGREGGRERENTRRNTGPQGTQRQRQRERERESQAIFTPRTPAWGDEQKRGDNEREQDSEGERRRGQV